MTDKNFCASSYLAFRYVEKDGVEFADGLHHKNVSLIPDGKKIAVKTAKEIECIFCKEFEKFSKTEKLGILLSGGMDSACLASFMPKNSFAYTFRFEGGKFAPEELLRAENFSKENSLNLRYVDIDFEKAKRALPPLMKAKGAPVHSIEPQIFLATQMAKNDGVTMMVIGDAADYVFYGMDGLLSRDWTFDEFVLRTLYIDPAEVLKTPSDILYLYERYTFTNPKDVLKNPADVSYLFKRFLRADGTFDFLSFMDNVFSVESSSSYWNAFGVANLSYFDPYAKLKMAEPLDLKRVRSGQSKYLVRDLFRLRYPSFSVPEKNPMPRPVDFYFKDWAGPVRAEFKQNLDMKKFSGNQKWQLWCLEEFLNMIESENALEGYNQWIVDNGKLKILRPLLFEKLNLKKSAVCFRANSQLSPFNYQLTRRAA